MKIRLLTCSAPFLIDEKVFPPLGLMAVGTALRAQGHDVAIADDLDDSTECFAMGPTTPEYADALSRLRQIKQQSEAARVVIGGAHAIANVEECLADGFDVVTVGDGENITMDTFAGTGVVNLGRKLIDGYRIADRSLVDIHSYRYEINGKPATTIMTSRGCPWRCGFCANTERRVRFHSVGRIEREIAYLKNRWGFVALMIFDDVFILDKERVLLLCEALKTHGISWRCFVRGDLVVRHGQPLVNAMARSGCAEVAIGIESGSDRILQNIRKGESADTIRNAIAMLKHAGIRVKGLFIVGLPGENRASIEETQRFVEESPLDDADFTVYQPYRGSPIWDNRSDYDVSWDATPASQRFYKGRSGEYKCAVSTSFLSSAEIMEARDTLERTFKNGNSQ